MYSIFSLLPFLNTGILPTTVAILIYVGFSLGIFRLSKTFGLDHPGYAWVPFLRYRLLGQLADAYRESQGTATRYSRILPIVFIICECISLLASIGSTIALTFYLVGFITGYVLIIIGAVTELVILAFIGYILVMFAVFILIFASTVLSAATTLATLVSYAVLLWVLYPVYQRCDKENATLYIILSLLFDFAPAIILPYVAHKCKLDTEDGFDAYPDTSLTEV